MSLLPGALWRAGILVTLCAVFAAPAAARTADPAVMRYGNVLRTFNPALSPSQSEDMATHVLLVSSYYNLDPRLLIAIVGVESSWHAHAISRSGALGLGQLMPSTADGLGVLAADALENLDGTARYLRRMVQQAAGPSSEERYRLALASYNAGPQAVARFGGVPPFAETRAYVAKVMTIWQNLKALLPGNAEPPLTIPITRPVVRLVPHLVAHAAVIQRAYIERGRPPRMRAWVELPAGSVADFIALDSESLRVQYVAYSETTAAPRKTVGRWLARAFGSKRP